eukprot:PhM_4_TR8315/c0_g1_i1/m.77686
MSGFTTTVSPLTSSIFVVTHKKKRFMIPSHSVGTVRDVVDVLRLMNPSEWSDASTARLRILSVTYMEDDDDDDGETNNNKSTVAAAAAAGPKIATCVVLPEDASVLDWYITERRACLYVQEAVNNGTADGGQFPADLVHPEVCVPKPLPPGRVPLPDNLLQYLDEFRYRKPVE